MNNQEAPPTILSEQEKPNENTTKEEIQKNEIKDENPIKKPENKNPQLNEVATDEKEQENSIFKKYPHRLYGDLEFDIYDDKLEPDCIYLFDGRKYFVYFNLNELRNKLEVKIKELFDKNPKNFANLRKPLEDYMKTYQNEEYIDNYWISGTIFEKIKFIIGSEYYSKNKQIRAIKFAYIYSQVNSYLKELENNKKEKGINVQKCFGMIDSFNYKFEPQEYGNLQKITDEICKFNNKLNNLDEIKESLQTLEELMKKGIKDIQDQYKEKEKEEVLILYFMKKIDEQLSKIENCNIPENTEIYKKRRELRSQINRYFLQNIPKEKKGKNDNFFFGLDLEFKIIKDTKVEKKVILDGININNFFNTINKNFEDLRDHLFKFDKDKMKNGVITTEDRMNFICKYMSKVEKLEELKKNIKIEINKRKKINFNHAVDMADNGINGIKNIQEKDAKGFVGTARAIGNSHYQIIENNIEKELLQKTNTIIDYNREEIIKLIGEYELIEKIKNEKKKIQDGSFINGYCISRKIKSEDNQLLDFYSVDVIY